MKLPRRKIPVYVPILTGLFLVTIGGLVLATVLGLIPTGSQEFHSPRWIIGAVGVGLLCGGFVVWLPKRTPQWISTILAMIVWLMLLLVLNYTAIAPGQALLPGGLAVGQITQPAPDPTNGKLIVGTLSLVADGYTVWWIIRRVWKWPAAKHHHNLHDGEE